MIRRAVITKRNGEPIYGRVYSKGEGTDSVSLPPSIQASILLLSSSKSTAHATPYILEQSDGIWAFSFFESFAVVLQSTPDENVEWLKRRVLSLGKYVAKNLSGIINSWPGEVSFVEGVSETIDEFVRAAFVVPTANAIEKIDAAINGVLSKYQVAYAGVFDAVGQMIVGNIPESHIEVIRSSILQNTVKSSIDLVPTTIEAKGYDVQAVRVRSLTTVVAPYIGGSKMAAVQAVDELAQTIERLVKK